MSVSHSSATIGHLDVRSNRYKVVCLIGKGGSALILLGKHLNSNQEVAIKVPRPQVENAASLLRHEARLLAGLQHPHVIRMYKHGMKNNQPFLVLDYAPYGNLRNQYPAHQALPLPTIIHFVNQISAGLQYIHSKGLIHCDIKPENMLLLRPDYLVLSDFGIAIPEQAVSIQKRRAGTIRYMAPEQLRGTPCRASDQYALAILVYEWLSGEPPFVGTSFQIMQQHISACPPRLQRSATTFPSDIDYVLKKALAKDPTNRFSSVEEFSAALKESSKKSHYTIYRPAAPKNYGSACFAPKNDIGPKNGLKYPGKQKRSKRFLRNLLSGRILLAISSFFALVLVYEIYFHFILVICSISLFLLYLFMYRNTY